MARVREIATPEGVPLRLELADLGERATAVIIDLLVIATAIGLLVVLGIFAFARAGLASWGLSLALLIFFALRNFYFIYFELSWRGATPGKWLLGIRVIDRNGGALSADAIFARNLMRELELFIPIMLILSPTMTGAAGWAQLGAILWIGVFIVLPFVNEDGLRAGDIVAGTWVISLPKAELARDVAEDARAAAASMILAGDDSGFVFTAKELDAYGILELQTLELVLRQEGPNVDETLRAVADRIRKRIGRPPDTAGEDCRPFLAAYYKALRAHLERKMLLGERRADKRHGQTGAESDQSKTRAIASTSVPSLTARR